jgi:hypothetical protein
MTKINEFCPFKIQNIFNLKKIPSLILVILDIFQL